MKTSALTEQDVSKILGCTKASLRLWRRNKKGPQYYKIGRLVRYKLEDVIKYRESKLVQTEDY